MSTFAPTTYLTLQAPTSGTDDYGDPLDGYTTETDDVPATVAERRKHVFDPTSSRAGTITYHEALVPGSVTVTKGYRVQDKGTGETLFVTHVHRPQNLAFPDSVTRLELTDPDGMT